MNVPKMNTMKCSKTIKENMPIQMNKEVEKNKTNKKNSKEELVVKHNDRIIVVSKLYNIIIDNQTCLKYLKFQMTSFKSKQRMKISVIRMNSKVSIQLFSQERGKE